MPTSDWRSAWLRSGTDIDPACRSIRGRQVLLMIPSISDIVPGQAVLERKRACGVLLYQASRNTSIIAMIGPALSISQ